MAIRDVPGQPVIGFFTFTPYVTPRPPELGARDVVEVVKRGHDRKRLTKRPRGA